jgi:tetratricopeptide (TPR) repeat protein
LLGLGKRREAERCCEEALAMVRAVDNGRVESRVLGTLARVRHERGELDRAREALEQALAIDRTLGARWYQALHLGMLADVELESGRALEAWSLYGRALEELADVRDPVTAAGLHARLGAAQAMLGRAAEAAQHFDDGRQALAEAGASGGDVAATWQVHAGQLDLALARAAAASGDMHAVAEHVDAARARLSHAASAGSEGGRSLIERSDEARFACRLLEREIAGLQTETDTTDEHRQASGGRRVDMLLIGPEAEWFERPGSPRVTLLRRRSARRILARLVERRMAAPGRALTVPELFEAGWGGERIRRDAMQNRVYVALAKLRQLGLRPLLQSRADGFLIAPEVRVVAVGGDA